MFIREVKKQRSKDSKVFYQYNLVQTSRIMGKVKQKVILYLGSDSILQDKKARNLVLESLKSLIFNQPELFPSTIPDDLRNLAYSYYEKYLLRYNLDDSDAAVGEGVSIPPLPQKADFHQVDLHGIEVSDVRSFGAEHLCSQVLDKLGLADYLSHLGFKADQVKKSLIAIAARAIFSSSEHKTAQILEMNSELKDYYGLSSAFTHKQLYHTSDLLYRFKEQIDSFLYQRTTDMFDIEDKLVIFDISNTYFETSKKNSKLGEFARSKEKRNDLY